MAKKKATEYRARNKVEVAVDCDTSKLYNSDINVAINYLIEMRDKYQGLGEAFGLEEHWTGYEDMEMRFSYVRDENDEEYFGRLRREDEARKRREEENAREERRKSILKEIERLQRSL